MIEFLSLPGQTPYAKARELQLELVEKRIADQIPDTLILLEHPPVITRGRGLQFGGANAEKRAMPLPPLPPTIEFFETERGGDLTYHGPGQLVIYPIFKLEGKHALAPARDIGLFLRRFEEWVMSFLREGYGLEPEQIENATGVWIKTPTGEKRKIASMGIAVRRWVTFHGLALNAVNDLAPFGLFSPCGYAAEVMTRIKDWSSLLSDSRWREPLESQIREHLRLFMES